MKKVIVTGASGFIGKYVVRQLISKGIEVIAVIRKNSKNRDQLDKRKIRIIECNMEEIDQLKYLISDRDIDTVFHIAWQGVSDLDSKDYNCQINNINNTISLLETMKEMNIGTIVGAGSIHEIESVFEVCKNEPIMNLSMMYKASKLATHLMCKTVAGYNGIRFLWPIIINAYGEEEYSKRLINSTIMKILSGETPKLSMGDQMYDFVHVQDVANAMVLIGEKGIDGKNYIIGSGNPHPLKYYLEIIGDITNEINNSNVPMGYGEIKSGIVYLPKEAFITEELYKDTGFKIEIPFDVGIRRTAKWLMENKSCFNSI